ncbi:hypothetical protein ATCC90586_003689 [Pythium insidiosum]|nr:hypothetical protein ATCC90586_003689 [Pythium insidiosum]
MAVMDTSASLKRPLGAAPGDGTAAAAPATAIRATSVSSGRVVVVGMHVASSLQCAGMALLRVFQGHVELLGWQPALGTYYSVHSPKWNSLLVIHGRAHDAAARDGRKALLDAEYQASFDGVTAELFAAMEPHAPSVGFDADEEHAADRLAREMAETFPIVLVLRAAPVTFGNVMCYYETPAHASTVVLPGFKLIVTKDELARLVESSSSSSEAMALAGSTHSPKPAAQVLRELVVADPSRPIQISSGWQSAVEALEQSLRAGDSAQRIVVCGGKDVGKSTFCRYLVNRLLALYDVVAFLDTDLGQPELTPPGMVSLHALTTPLLGPGFTHMKTPLRAFFCGGTNPGTDPLYYMRAVQSLLRLYERKYSKSPRVVPLVINTDGWVKSMGHDLLCSVIAQAAPQHIVQLLSTTRSKQFDLPSHGPWRVHSVEPWDPVGSATVQAPRSSKEMRLYRLHSYFLGQTRCTAVPRQQLQNLHFITEKDRLSASIVQAYGALSPFAVPFDAVDVAFAGASVPPSQVLLSLNCSVVGLCVNPQRAPRESDAVALAGPPRIQLHRVHAPCVGLGLVRAVDAERRCLLVLSPLPLELLRHVNLLVRGNISVDPLVVAAEATTQAPPYGVLDVIPSEGSGSTAMQSRNNIKRKREDGGNPGPQGRR